MLKIKASFLPFKIKCGICNIESNFTFPQDINFQNMDSKNYVGVFLNNCGHTYYVGIMKDDFKIESFNEIIANLENDYSASNSLEDFKTLKEVKETFKYLNGIDFNNN